MLVIKQETPKNLEVLVFMHNLVCNSLLWFQNFTEQSLMALNMFSSVLFVIQISDVTKFLVKKIIGELQLSKYNISESMNPIGIDPRSVGDLGVHPNHPGSSLLPFESGCLFVFNLQCHLVHP